MVRCDLVMRAALVHKYRSTIVFTQPQEVACTGSQLHSVHEQPPQKAAGEVRQHPISQVQIHLCKSEVRIADDVKHDALRCSILAHGRQRCRYGKGKQAKRPEGRRTGQMSNSTSGSLCA